MTGIQNILSQTSHRPFAMPPEPWVYYQEWNKALFLHWEIPLEVLRKLVPEKLNIDTFDGKCYVSLVAFTMEKIRPKNLPSWSFISDFAEINVRTYIENDGRKGVYFLNIEAQKLLSVFVAKTLSGLPYQKANMQTTATSFKSHHAANAFSLDAEFEVNEALIDKTDLDQWLTERYCLYLDKNNAFFRYDIHHAEWPIKKVELQKLKLHYQLGELKLENPPHLTHYSDGVKVLAWKKQRI